MKGHHVKYSLYSHKRIAYDYREKTDHYIIQYLREIILYVFILGVVKKPAFFLVMILVWISCLTTKRMILAFIPSFSIDI